MAAYEAEDAAPAVVVLHGLGTSVDALREAVPGVDPFARLARAGLRVLALDWPGHGRSGGARGHLTYRLAMDAAAVATRAAEQRWQAPVGLLGTGFGGTLAFYAALEDGRAGAVVCHTVLDLRDVRPVLRRTRQSVLLPLAARLHRLLPGERGRRLRVPTAAVLPAADLADGPGLALRLRRHPQAVHSYDLESLGSLLLAPEDKPDVAAATTPALLAVGSGDRVLPETWIRHFASRLACPHELWVLPGGGHQLLLEHPDAFVPVAAGFLRRHLAVT
jgi:alpha-beta hydrolase superfamily lysophospholipase